ncbi:hypothetical protein H8S90_20675 [Olivibacter sp. SDN3]|uniref:hypothetical protein n=1 Tax=Olivibacter sp. SDN3 TaxID=2764720 RepID=UPI0016511483|nr:hypothetical protein [Olivibacter sp. SDN3]QNL49133.1 hypothetical protein H8S90_20675 [Olivibacter sp. SDN3]
MRSNYLTKSVLSLCAALGLLGIIAFKDISVNRTEIPNKMAIASDAVIMREFKNIEFDFDNGRKTTNY